MSLFHFWDLKWNIGADHPHDIDFRFNGFQYFDIELRGDIWAGLCDNEVIQPSFIFTTNNGGPAEYNGWKPIRWFPDAVNGLPKYFVIKAYTVYIYSDAQRTTILERTDGLINVNDNFLLDEICWFPTYFIAATNSQSLPHARNYNLDSELLQPKDSHLIITKTFNGGQPEVILDQFITETIRTKKIEVNAPFKQYGTYQISFKVITNISYWVNNWCPPVNDFVDERIATIRVGDV